MKLSSQKSNNARVYLVRVCARVFTDCRLCIFVVHFTFRRSVSRFFGNLLVALSSVSWWVVVSLRRYVKIARFFSSIAYDEHTYTYSLSSAGSVWCFCYSFFNNNFITSAFSFSSVLPCFWCASSFFLCDRLLFAKTYIQHL